MARRSQCSSAGDNPLDPNYLPPHYREEYRLAIDALIEEDLEGYYQFLQKADVVDFLALPEIEYIQSLIQAPQLSNYPEQQHLETGGDGSSDTYWPIHSDLDAPGLDLGWPQMHHFMGPTEVTTLVNPPEPNMPSIKDQARRLIKNAQQVIAIVMDMFTDVDMFADILSAAMRNVAVYILLDEQNAHHFINMVSNCRVNLQGIQLLRVRTVSGITYHCRTGKSLKGQMMDRFLLTDCRAVLSGNYSFMWSFEKLHRCMAHLFLGQLVSTFDEEFRILFAQSQPLVIENYNPREEFNLSQKRQYPGERTMYREPKKFQSMDTAHPEQWQRQPHDEPMDMDWRMVPLKKQDSLHGPAEMYGRFTPQLSRMDPPFDQGPPRMPMMENPAFKRHSYAEGGHGRYSSPFLQQQRVPEPENQGRQFYRGQQPYPGPGPAPGKEADYSAYDKFWNQDFHPADQYSEPGLEQEIDVPDNFDLVRNYLASTRNPDFDQDVDLSFGSPHHRKLSSGQLQASQMSPIPSNPTDEKQYLQVPNTDRKDPKVKRGLRNWRISSYLSAYDNPGDEGLPSAPPNESDPFEDLSNPIQQIPAIEISVPKIPNVREFKVPAIPRASQLPSYAKTAAQEQPKKLPDELTVVVAETKTTPTPSESSSSTTEVEKFEDAELKEPKPSGLRREDSFRRKYNAAMPRSSRLRSSLIFSSMDQQQPSQDPKTEEEESGKNEAEQTKLPFASQFLGQRRVTGREPFEWSRYMKSATFDNSTTDPSKPDGGTSKPDDKDSPKNENPKDLTEVPKSLKPDVEQATSSPSMPQSKASEAELPKTDQPVQPPEPLLTTPLFLDMNDPDNRLMFFKELAAKRKAAKAAEAEKSKDKAPVKPTTELTSNTTVRKEEPVPKESSEKMADTSTSEGSSETKATAEDKTNKKDSQVKTDPNATQSCKQKQTKVSTDSENNELKNSQSSATLPVSAKTEAPQSKTPEELKLPNPSVKTSSPNHPPTDPPTVKREESVSNESSENMADPSTSEGLLGTNATTEDARKTVSTEASKSVSLSPDAGDKTNKQDSQIKTDPKTSQSCKQDQTKGSTDSKKTELKNSQSATPQSKPPEELKQSIPAVKGSSPSHPSRPTDQPTVPKESSEKMVDPSTSEGLLGTNATTKDARKTVSTEASKSASLSSVASDKTNKQVKSGQDSQVKTDPQTSQSCKQDQSKVSTDSKTTELKNSQSAATSSHSHPPTTANATPTSVPSLTHGTDGDESLCLDSTSKENVPPTPALDSNTLNPESVQLETSVSPEQHKGSESRSSKPSVQSSSSDQILPDNVSQISPSPAPTPTETISCSVTPSDSSSAPTSSTLSPNAQESVSSSPPEPSQLASSKTLSAADTCAAGSEPNTSSLQSASETDPKESCATTPSEKDVPESENKSVSKGVGDESEVSGSSKDVKAESTRLPNGSDLETKSRSAQNETTTPSPTDTPPKHSPAEISSPVNPDFTPNASQSERQVTPPSELNLTGSGSPAETVPSSPPLTESVGSVLSPEAEKTLPALHSSETNCLSKKNATDSIETPMLSSTESTTEPTSNVPTEPDLQCGTPESVTSETHPTEPSVPAEKSNVDSQSEVSKEPNPEANDTKATNEVNKTTQESVEKANDQVTQNNCSEPPGEVVPPSTQSKQPKSGQSRYQTSTANVLSSSNLRDDTKLLLGQISANSQSRNEAAKESSVTDDEKEDKADKKAIQEKERGIRSHTRGQSKAGPEREKLLEKIQSMRKERRVYSRFEMAP